MGLSGSLIVLDKMILNIDVFNTKSYILDEKTFKDLSNSRNSGKLIGENITYSLNPATFVINTNVNSKNYLELDNKISFNNSDEYTIEMYIKLNPTIQKGKQSLLGDGGINGNLILEYLDNLDWKLMFRDINGNFYDYTDIIHFDIINNWCNIIFTVDNKKLVSVFINGTKIKEIEIQNSEFNISRIMGGYEYNGKYQTFMGCLSNIKIYNKVFNVNEVKQNINTLAWRYVEHKK